MFVEGLSHKLCSIIAVIVTFIIMESKTQNKYKTIVVIIYCEFTEMRLHYDIVRCALGLGVQIRKILHLEISKILPLLPSGSLKGRSTSAIV